MLSQLKSAVLITIFFTVLTGILYPLAVTGAARILFPKQAAGSLIEEHGKVIGSEIIGQNFTQPQYFHPRPSAAGSGYDGANSGGSNLGATNPALADRLRKDAARFREENPDFHGAIPSDAITTSASGLDPDISPANALAQAARVALSRGASPDVVRNMVRQHTEGRKFGVLGEPRVNVLSLNRDLDRALPLNGKPSAKL